MINIANKIRTKIIDYKSISDNNVVLIKDSDEDYDINFFIPVRGRVDFAKPMYESFKKASEKSDFKITYTVVEHSEKSEHLDFCEKNDINYIWIKSEPGELFNKCLCYNMGVFFSSKSKYCLFHDIDCLVQSDFFLRLKENISNKKCRAIQCFRERRVLYINEKLTKQIVSEDNFDVDKLSINLSEVNYPALFGAPGGSRTVF
jgi:predicted glycosyltransferase involved in capsule biosynthesis